VSTTARERPAVAAPQGSLGREAARTAFALGLLGALGAFLARSSNPVGLPVSARLVDTRRSTGAVLDLCGPPATDGRPVVVDMLYSADKQGWIEYAANRFARRCPNIQLKLTARGDIEAADAMLAGEPPPSVWAPADNLVVRYLEAHWKKEPLEPLRRGDAAVSLVRSPLVILIWEDRLRVFEAIERSSPGDLGPWASIACALVPRDPDVTKVVEEDMIPGRWSDWYDPLTPPAPAGLRGKKPVQRKPDYEAPFPTAAERRGWGRVKFVHPSPARSPAGLEALYLMAYDYLLPPRERSEPAAAPSPPPGAGKKVGSEHLHDAFAGALAERGPAFGRWLRRCEGGIEGAPESEALLTSEMFDVGPSRYDAITTFEHLVFPILTEVNDHPSAMKAVRVYYPETTVVSHHPVLFFGPETPANQVQRGYARKWIDFLQSKEMQERAIDDGFRPGNPETSIRDHDVDATPFLHLRRLGISIDAGSIEPPELDGNAIHALVDAWEDATGSN
jgi:hypothetical protein